MCLGMQCILDAERFEVDEGGKLVLRNEQFPREIFEEALILVRKGGSINRADLDWRSMEERGNDPKHDG